MGYIIRELLDGGLLHEDVKTVWGGEGLRAYTIEPKLGENGTVLREPVAAESADKKVLSTCNQPFQVTGGLKMLKGNLGTAVIKTSAVKADRHIIEAPAIVFDSQAALQDAFKAGKLDRDFVAIVRFQGPRANGMPELHKLTPALGVLQDRGHMVALVTDGRMSGASGKVPAAIHVTPEALDGGIIGKIRDGDVVRLDAEIGTLDVLEDPEVLAARPTPDVDISHNSYGMGRELFAAFRNVVGKAENGASVFGL